MDLEFTSRQINELIKLPINTLHYYIEAGAMVPDIDEGQGRGKKRKFSIRNLFEASIIKHLMSLGVQKKSIIKYLRSIKNADERNLLYHETLDYSPGRYLIFFRNKGEHRHRFITNVADCWKNKNRDDPAAAIVINLTAWKIMFDLFILTENTP